MLRGIVVGCAAVCMLASSGEAVTAQSVSDPYAALEGKWIWVGDVDDPGTSKACAEKWTELKFSPDRKTLNYRYLDGDKGIINGTYNVLYQDDSSIAMYLNGEDRRLKNSGDRFIWIAIVENKTRFLWRIHGQATNAAELAKFARVRCPD